MRELKFRAIYKPDLEKKEYLPFIMKVVNDELIFVMENDEDFKYPFQAVFQDDDWIKLQYAGLKDKNNREVYEGDKIIIHQLNRSIFLTEVIFMQGAFLNNYTKELLPKSEDIEVIGNIYEHPELCERVVEGEK